MTKQKNIIASMLTQELLKEVNNASNPNIRIFLEWLFDYVFNNKENEIPNEEVQKLVDIFMAQEEQAEFDDNTYGTIKNKE